MTHAAHIEEETYEKTVFGFWVYLMTDCILFATLFSTYAVLHNNIDKGPSAQELFSMPYALIETIILLVSSLTCGFGLIAIQNKAKNAVLFWLGATFLLGAAFLALELHEFNNFIQEGNGWQKSAFLSSFFTLVGTHGLHITFGLLWIVVLAMQLMIKGITWPTLRRMACFSMYWHFLDLIWIFIFSFVYLLGGK